MPLWRLSEDHGGWRPLAPRSGFQQEDAQKEVTGPPKKIAFDAQGKPTRAAESFASKQGVTVESLYVIDTPRGEYLAAKQLIKGRTASECLAEILPRAIAEITWPRTMYWTGCPGQDLSGRSDGWWRFWVGSD